MSGPRMHALSAPPTLRCIAMPCAFCRSNSRLTKEHVFPAWLDSHLPGGRPYWVLEQDRFVGERPYQVRRPSQSLDFTVRTVCADCNNGWMSALEVEAKPILERLLTNTNVQPLMKDEQLVAGRWATKTAMMMDFTQEELLVPQRDRTLFFKRRTIPRRAWIWLGGCNELLPLTMSHTMRAEMEPIEGGERTVGFFTPIKVGHLVIYWVLQASPSRFRSVARGIWRRGRYGRSRRTSSSRHRPFSATAKPSTNMRTASGLTC